MTVPCSYVSDPDEELRRVVENKSTAFDNPENCQVLADACHLSRWSVNSWGSQAALSISTLDLQRSDVFAANFREKRDCSILSYFESRYQIEGWGLAGKIAAQSVQSRVLLCHKTSWAMARSKDMKSGN